MFCGYWKMLIGFWLALPYLLLVFTLCCKKPPRVQEICLCIIQEYIQLSDPGFPSGCKYNSSVSYF